MAKNIFRVSCVLFLAVGLWAAVSAGVATAPPAAFTNLQTTTNCSLVQDFCNGYLAGELQPIPLPTFGELYIWDYLAVVRKVEFPRSVNGAISDYYVGYDSAIENAAGYFWNTSPTSCHNVDCTAVH